MTQGAIQAIERVGFNLLDFKTHEALKEVYLIYKSSMARYFDSNGRPISEFFEEIDCPICRSAIKRHKLTIDNFQYLECLACRAVYNSPSLKPDVIERMYRSGEYEIYAKKLVLPNQDFRKNVLEKRKCQQITTFFESPGRILDVGCGTGSFLRNFREKDWTVIGIDPSENAARFAREKYDIDIIQDEFENYQWDEPFDCITFWGLEHLADPFRGLERAVSMLNPIGLIVFEGPSADSFLMKFLCRNSLTPYRFIESARHVLFFSRRAIDYFCEELKLKVAYLETIGLDIDTILLKDFDPETKKKLIQIQETVNELMLGDHYRVFLTPSD